jgi:hypothetical protein
LILECAINTITLAVGIKVTLLGEAKSALLFTCFSLQKIVEASLIKVVIKCKI